MTEYTLFGRCRDLCAAERRHYLLREPVQLFQRLDERGAERHATTRSVLRSAPASSAFE